MNKILTAITFLLFVCATCYGQTSYKGLTPGKSTRADVERVLGQPVSKPSETLIEYRALSEAPSEDTGLRRIFVQYRKETPVVVERIELICGEVSSLSNKCKDGDLHKPALRHGVVDSVSKTETPDFTIKIFYASPAYVVETNRAYLVDETNSRFEVRWALYSTELYEGAVPKGDCIGAFVGRWETNRGLVTVRRDAGSRRVRGIYLTNDGTFTGIQAQQSVIGEWKDNTGSGTMILSMSDKEFLGRWRRTSGAGPSEGVWEGRCVGN